MSWSGSAAKTMTTGSPPLLHPVERGEDHVSFADIHNRELSGHPFLRLCRAFVQPLALEELGPLNLGNPVRDGIECFPVAAAFRTFAEEGRHEIDAGTAKRFRVPTAETETGFSARTTEGLPVEDRSPAFGQDLCKKRHDAGPCTRFNLESTFGLCIAPEDRNGFERETGFLGCDAFHNLTFG